MENKEDVNIEETISKENRDKIVDLCLDGLCTDGGHHKQYYLEEILKLLEPTADEIWNISWEEGIG